MLRYSFVTACSVTVSPQDPNRCSAGTPAAEVQAMLRRADAEWPHGPCAKRLDFRQAGGAGREASAPQHAEPARLAWRLR